VRAAKADQTQISELQLASHGEFPMSVPALGSVSSVRRNRRSRFNCARNSLMPLEALVGLPLALDVCVNKKRFLYMLRSSGQVHRYYTGLTSDPIARLQDHNAGGCPHAASGRPWTLIVTVDVD